MQLRIRDASVTYPTLTGSTAALENLSLDLSGSSFVCVVGPSGCGKSTLLKLASGLLPPSRGTVKVTLERDPARLECALVFQDHCVFPWMTVLDNVAFGLEFAQLGRAERRDEARAYIDKVGLTAFAKSYPHELSVGMRQRVALARALVANPQILLMDEPFAALDALTKLILQEELLRMWGEYKPLIVYVTHDLAEAVLLADRILVMSGRPGGIVSDVEVSLARPRDLKNRSRSEVTEIEQRLWLALEHDVRRAIDGGSS